MKKRFKLLHRNGKIHILKWETDGKLFGPEWECIATFDNVHSNQERVKAIIQLMNLCDKHSEINNNDRARTTKN